MCLFCPGRGSQTSRKNTHGGEKGFGCVQPTAPRDQGREWASVPDSWSRARGGRGGLRLVTKSEAQERPLDAKTGDRRSGKSPQNNAHCTQQPDLLLRSRGKAPRMAGQPALLVWVPRVVPALHSTFLQRAFLKGRVFINIWGPLVPLRIWRRSRPSIQKTHRHTVLLIIRW